MNSFLSVTRIQFPKREQNGKELTQKPVRFLRKFSHVIFLCNMAKLLSLYVILLFTAAFKEKNILRKYWVYQGDPFINNTKVSSNSLPPLLSPQGPKPSTNLSPKKKNRSDFLYFLYEWGKQTILRRGLSPPFHIRTFPIKNNSFGTWTDTPRAEVGLGRGWKEKRGNVCWCQVGSVCTE